MQSRKLGRHDQQVSIIGLGAEHLEKIPAEQAEAIIAAALDNGINIMDLFMPNPEIRDTIGRALKGRRQQMLIQGHLGTLWVDGQYKRSREAEPSREHLEDLLRRLQTDYIDILMIHYLDKLADVDTVFAAGGLFECALKLQQQGKARFIGISSHEVGAARKAIELSLGKLDVLMFSINPYHDLLPGNTDVDTMFKFEEFEGLAEDGRNQERAELFQLCAREGVAITVMKPYAGGYLFSDSSPFGVLTPAQCLHYALSRPGVASVLAGYNTLEQLQATLHYLKASDEEKDLQPILQQKNWALTKGVCMYCNHCLPCPMHLDIAALQRLNDIWQEDATVQGKLKEAYGELTGKASQCIECGSCEKACPFAVPVIQRMQQIRQRFE